MNVQETENVIFNLENVNVKKDLKMKNVQKVNLI